MCSIQTFFSPSKSFKASKRTGRCLSGRLNMKGPPAEELLPGFFWPRVYHGSSEVSRAGGSINEERWGGWRGCGGNQHRLFKRSVRGLRPRPSTPHRPHGASTRSTWYSETGSGGGREGGEGQILVFEDIRVFEQQMVRTRKKHAGNGSTHFR